MCCTSLARKGNGSLCGCRLHRRGEAPGSGGPTPPTPKDTGAQAWQGQSVAGGANQGTDQRVGAAQGAGARESRACLPCRQKPLRFSQSPLPRLSQKYGATAHALRSGKPGARQAPPPGRRKRLKTEKATATSLRVKPPKLSATPFL